MRLSNTVTLGAAAGAVELKLCEAAERKDAADVDRLLDMLRALSDLEDFEGAGAGAAPPSPPRTGPQD